MTGALQEAIAGKKIILDVNELSSHFVAEDDLQCWCNTFGLQFEYDGTTEQYTISKII